MSNELELQTCAMHILDFFKETFPRTEDGRVRTLAQRIEILSSWLEDKNDFNPDKQKYAFYQQRSRARQLRELYEKGNLEAIARYGRTNVDTMTGGLDSYYAVPFHNETTQNHLRHFDPEYVGNPLGEYARESKTLDPYYQKMKDAAVEINERALDVRREILASIEFRSAKGKPVSEIRAIYLVEEFKRKDKVIPLLVQVEDLYSDAILLSKSILKLYKAQFLMR